MSKIQNPKSVTPAKAGVQNLMQLLDSRLRGNDDRGRFRPFYKTVNVLGH